MTIARSMLEELSRSLARRGSSSGACRATGSGGGRTSGPFEVHIARAFPLEQAAEAHRALDEHYLGKLALRPG